MGSLPCRGHGAIRAVTQVSEQGGHCARRGQLMFYMEASLCDLITHFLELTLFKRFTHTQLFLKFTLNAALISGGGGDLVTFHYHSARINA